MMHSRSMRVLVSAMLAAVPVSLVAQQASKSGAPVRNGLGRGAGPLVPDNVPFNKHDLSGVWLGNKYGYNATHEPPMTPEGKKKFDAQKPSYGATLGTPAA